MFAPTVIFTAKYRLRVLNSPINNTLPSRSVIPIINGTFVNFPCASNVVGCSVRKAPFVPGGSKTGEKGNGLMKGFLAS